MTHASLFACRDARGRHWQLGPLPPATGRLTLIGWSTSAERHDAGVPEDVAHVLARALTSVGRVTFACSSVNAVATGVWSPLGNDLVRVLKGQGVRGRIVAKLRGTPREITLLSTRQPETAMRLFGDAGFPWWLQGQVVLLSAPDAAPPDIDVEALTALVEEDWTTVAASIAAPGIEGIMRPGVDGDVAGLLSLSDTFDEVVLAALERETRLAGFDWAVVPERAFAIR